MIVPNSSRIDRGDAFPPLDVTLVGGRRLRVPEEFDHLFQVILFYRGSWCSFCQTQLKSFQAGLATLDKEGIGVLAASSEDEEHSAATIESLGLTFPVAYGLPVTETAGAIGAFYAEAPGRNAPYLQSTGFLLGPDHRAMVSVYSSGAIGRLAWQDVLGTVQYAKKV